ncbi:hypothetical protein [Nocardia pseudovaccinii]|uniref:hypothetical protein n=1 Tax=Nocardia pseudovaccinii TaxID=189540 RepID=UPI0007A382EB|nr:hypothetical protein [Nocardia pseudovaccinii]
MKDPHDQLELAKPDLWGAAAVTAAFIALILGVLTGIAGILWILYVLVDIEDRARESSVEIGQYTNLIIMGIVAVAIGLLWFVGGFLLLAEKTTGRVLLILASGVGLIASIAQLFNSGFAYLFIPITVSLLILVLCVVPATGGEIAADESEPNPLAHGQDQY